MDLTGARLSPENLQKVVAIFFDNYGISTDHMETYRGDGSQYIKIPPGNSTDVAGLKKLDLIIDNIIATVKEQELLVQKTRSTTLKKGGPNQKRKVKFANEPEKYRYDKEGTAAVWKEGDHQPAGVTAPPIPPRPATVAPQTPAFDVQAAKAALNKTVHATKEAPTKNKPFSGSVKDRAAQFETKPPRKQ